MKTYLHSLLSEWQKTRHSAASWLVLIGGLFVPLLLTIVQSVYPDKLSPLASKEHYWSKLFQHSWESMAILLLPAGIIIATSLIAQLEYRNHTWKQVFATPQRFSTLFFSKFTVVVILLLQFFILNFIGLFLCAYLPAFWGSGGTPSFPPLDKIIDYNIRFFIASLPLLAIQFFIAMRYKNFLISIGIGIGILVASIFAFSWKYGYLFPFAQIGMVFTQITGHSRVPENFPQMLYSVLWFLGISASHFILYLSQKERA